ncbi:MAG: YccF domain-containing protein [Burkholderiaceae bacterium]|nr:YccF domain-containing protein [Burkholderiaceae bacterium]
MRTIGNILWLILGGFVMGLGWWLAGALAFITIVGIPWGRACFVIGQFAFLPFGREAVDRASVTGQLDIGTGPLGLLGNIIWFVFAGVWLAMGHLVSALACFITVIGIPFGIQHLKLAVLALMPIGKTIVTR